MRFLLRYLFFLCLRYNSTPKKIVVYFIRVTLLFLVIFYILILRNIFLPLMILILCLNQPTKRKDGPGCGPCGLLWVELKIHTTTSINSKNPTTFHIAGKSNISKLCKRKWRKLVTWSSKPIWSSSLWSLIASWLHSMANQTSTHMTYINYKLA